jgi:Protein of unknown function (DUF2953).
MIEHGEKFYMEGNAAWLLHFINAGFSHIEGKLHIQVKVLCFTLFDNLKPKQIKVRRKKISKKEKASIKKKKAYKKKKAQIAKTQGNTDKNSKAVRNKTANTEVSKERRSAEEAKIRLKETTSRQKELADKKLSPEEMNSMGKEGYSPGETNKRRETIQSQKEDNSENKTAYSQMEKNRRSDTIQLLKENNNKEKVGYSPEDDNSNGDTKQSEMENEGNISIFRRIYLKIIHMKEKIVAFFIGLKDKIIKWYDNAVNIKQKINLVSAFITDELNREGFQITFLSLKKLLKHILPTKLNSRIEFGTGDPCSTGQALGAMGILYSFYGDKIVGVPDFENKKFEGKHYAKGRIRLITILIIVIRLIVDKRFKILKSNFQILKEAL